MNNQTPDEVDIEIEKINDAATIPELEHEGDAGIDLAACMPKQKTFQVSSRSTLIPTGLRFKIPNGYEMQIRSRSRLAHEHGVFVTNQPGTIDPFYRGEVKILLSQAQSSATGIGSPFRVRHGDRIAQAVLARRVRPQITVTDAVSKDTEREESGFGSTGVSTEE